MSKKILISLTVILVFNVPHILNAQNFQWVKNQTVNIQFSPDFALFISATDNSGNSFLGSIYQFKQAFGQSYFGDVAIKKYNYAGVLLFTKIMYGKILIENMQTDNEGNVYVSGKFFDTLKIDSVNQILNTGSGFNVNYFLIKLDGNGNFVWKKNINSLYTNQYSLDAIKVRNNYLYAGIMNISQSYIKKYDLNGNELLSISQNPVVSISSIDADSQGNIYAGGPCTNGTITFGGITSTALYFYNIYFVKYNSTGNGQWVKFVEDITFQSVDIACDNSGNLYAAGDLSGSFMFGNIQSQGPQWVYDFFVTKMDALGNFLWLRETPQTQGITGDAKKAKINSLAVDVRDNVYFTGFLRGTMNWGNNIVTTSTGFSSNILLLQFNSNGQIIFGKAAGGAGGDRADDIDLDNSGNIFLCGNFSSTVTFDSISVIGSGNINSFLTKMSSPLSGTLNMSAVIQGFYNNVYGTMNMSDTMKIFLRNSKSPYSVVDSSSAVINSSNFTGSFQFTNAQTGQYYIQTKHRNALETWSGQVLNYVNGLTHNYNFTNSISQAYGNNMIRVNSSPSIYAIYNGDVNHDETIDVTDLIEIYNNSLNLMSGYSDTDLTGDNFTDVSDLIIVYNNITKGVNVIKP